MMNGIISNPSVLSGINLFVPDNYLRSRGHLLFYPPQGRTGLMERFPVGRAARLFNELASRLDIFNVTYREFVRMLELYLQ
jgi:hypothetical protein